MKKRFLLFALLAVLIFGFGPRPAGATAAAISQTQVLLHFIGTFLGASNLTQPQVPLALQQSITFSNGAGANQGDFIWQDSRTLSASASESLDLQTGALTDNVGTAITLSKLKVLVVVASGANTNDVLVGGAGANAITGPWGSTTDYNTIKPGGMFLIAAPTAAGYTVDGTHKLLKVANSSSGTSVTYQIYVLGYE
jgi:hypothetical protein